MFNTKKNFGNFTVSIGGDNNQENSVSFYIKGRCRITPTEKMESYCVDGLKTKHNSFMNDYLKHMDSIYGVYIYNVDVSETSIKYGKKSYLKYELFFKPKDTTYNNVCNLCKNVHNSVVDNVSKLFNEYHLKFV